jgi:hypothetical protein
VNCHSRESDAPFPSDTGVNNLPDEEYAVRGRPVPAIGVTSPPKATAVETKNPDDFAVLDEGYGPPRQIEGWDAGAPMSAPKFLGAIWGFTRPFERISRFWRIDFIPKLQKSAYFENPVKSDSRPRHQLCSGNHSGLSSRRLQHFSTTCLAIVVSGFCRTIEQPDSSVERSRTQVHVPLRRVQVLVSSQFLDGSRGRSAHRQMRTERVSEDMDTRLNVRSPPRTAHHHLDDFLRERKNVSRCALMN